MKITVNGEQYDADIRNDGKYTVKLDKDLPEGRVGIRVYAEDKSGNSVEKTYAFHYDKSAPTGLKASVSESYTSLNTGTYFKKAPKVVFSAEDKGVGVGTYTFDGKKTTDATFNLGDGEHTVAVADWLDNTVKVVSVADLMGWNSNKVVIDGTAPSVNRKSGFTPDKQKSGEDWYKKKPTLVYSVSDTNLRYVDITVNGKLYRNTSRVNGDFTVDLSSVSDGKVTVQVKVEDCAGNVSEDSYSFSLDTKAPTGLKAELTGNYLERDTGTFFKATPSIRFSAEDEGIGVDKYYLNSESKRDGMFNLPTGIYTVYADDELGNKTRTSKVSDLLGLKSNRVVVDGEAPKISCSKPTGGYNSWFKEDQNYNATITDDEGIYSATISINGSVVDKFDTSGRDVTSVSLTANTRSVQTKSDGSYDVKIEVEDKAGNRSEWSDTIFIDKSNPKITKFVFNGATITDGATMGGGDRYGFFFSGSGSVNIHADDGSVSSGLKEIVVDMGGTTRTVAVSGGVATVSIPAGFKGFISAYAVDNVGNRSDTQRPDGVVSESSNWHNNAVSVNLSLPSTSRKDSAGNPLYNSDVSVGATVGCSMSGIRSVSFGVGSETLGSATVDSNGNIFGNARIVSSDNNLVVSASSTISVTGNENALRVWVKVVDRLGNSSEDEKLISIDKDDPVLRVSFDKEVSDGSYYNTGRTATIHVSDRNFSKSGVKISGDYGKLGNWTRMGTEWVNTVSFEDDGKYNLNVVANDMAGNASTTYTSGTFTVDKTSPEIKVSFNNSDKKNGIYYSEKRIATVFINDVNFDESSLVYTGNGKLSDWRKGVDGYRATVDCSADGSYEFSLQCSDLAGNRSLETRVNKFIVDTKKPVVEISGIGNGVSYKKNISFKVTSTDENLDTEISAVTLTGRKNGDLEVTGRLNKDSGIWTFDGFDDDKKYDDVYTLKASCIDLAGNEYTEERVFSLNRYGSSYTSNELAQELGIYLSEAEDIVITESNIDRLDVSKCKVVVTKDGELVNVDKSKIKIDEEETSDGWKYTYTVDKSVFTSDGKYQIQVYSVSEDGTDYSNVAEEYSFILDTTAPEVIISGVEDGGRYREYSKHVTVEVRDLSGVGNIIIRVNGKNIDYSEKDGLYEFDVTENEKLQNIQVDVEDKAGNKSIAGVSGFFISSSMISYALNQPWFKFGVGGVVVFMVSILGLLLRRRLLVYRDEKTLVQEHKDLYDKSRSSSSGNGSDEK